MGRLLSDVIKEQMSKEITLSGEELYRMFMEAFYLGADISRYDPSPSYSRDKGFVESDAFKKLENSK